jgi:hypothetical protein
VATGASASVRGGGGGFGASATTGPDSPGIDEKEVAEARELGKRVNDDSFYSIQLSAAMRLQTSSSLVLGPPGRAKTDSSPEPKPRSVP